MGRFAGVVFLDRDGTLIQHYPYLSAPERVALTPGAGEAVARLNASNYAVVVVTNQSGLARGLVTETQLSAIHARLRALLRAESAALDALYYCPHLPDGKVSRYRRTCRCRKPGPGMVERAVRELGLEGLPAWVVGDDQRDLELAARVGARSILVRTGLGAATEQGLASSGVEPFAVVDDLRRAVARILD